MDAGYENISVTDAVGRTWQSGDIQAIGVIISLLTLTFVAVLSFFVIVWRPIQSARLVAEGRY